MRISSLSFMEPPAEPDHGFESPLAGVRPGTKRFFRKIDRMLTAMACAEAGDLDTVKEMLAQDRAQAKR
ncbi:MAG: hypothetical protein PHX38_04995 [Sulfuricella sp.]|nr:hypothetical protein [Sulfuricella sp.]